MDENFERSVYYRNQERLLPSRLVVTGHTRYFLVWAGKTERRFERDDEEAFRAIRNPEQAAKTGKPDLELLQAIADNTEAIGKK